MRRWNGWGDDTTIYSIPTNATQLLNEWVGPARTPKDAQFDEVLAAVPPSQLAEHPQIKTDARDRILHARGQSFPDWIALRSGQINHFPDGVAYPETAAAVAQLLHYAQATDTRLIPYGGGTSVAGHINPSGGQPVLTVNLQRLNQLHALDETSHLATFGAGVIGPDLEAQLRARGYTLGHFPQSFELATLGGWIATRSSGQQSLGYGRIEDLFAGGQVISPQGPLMMPSHPASAAGPDLRQLLLGSEGRLGIITEATVRISSLPEREDFHAVFFPDFEGGMEAVRTIMQQKVPLSLLRLSTDVETATTLAMAGHERLIGTLERLISLRGVGEGKCMLMLGFTGSNGLVKTSRKIALDICSDFGGVHVGRTFGDQWHKNRFHTPYLRNSLWEAGYGVDTVETAVTWQQVTETLLAIETALHNSLRDMGEKVHVFTHLSHMYRSGASIYTTYLFRLADTPQEQYRRWQLLKQAASEAIVTHGGTISHQHGVGIDHAPYLAAEKGTLGMGALRALTSHFDPQGIMNPGKLIEA